MAIKATELDKDFRDSFEKEDGTIDESITDDSLDQYWHLSQEDHFGGEESEKVKKFFDYIARHVFLPWLSALTKVFNLFKATVERDYLKTEKVQRHYDSESADPMSGKAVAEAIQLTDTQTIWEGISRTGHYWEAEGSKFWKMSLQSEILRKVIGDFDGEIYDGNTDGWAYKVRIFVRNIDTNQMFFISAGEALEAAMGNFEPVPIFAEASQEEIFDRLFPDVFEREDITSQASWYQLPSDDAKIELHTSVSFIYLCDENYNEPILHFKDGATSPYLLPDDLAEQETASEMWKAGNYFEGVGTEAAYLITTKEQEDKTAVSPTRLGKIIGDATETKTIYIPIARSGEWFTVTKEMAESGLIVRVCSSMPSDQVYWSLEYALGELYGTEAFSTGDIAVGVAGYEGYQMKFTFSDLDGHGGTAQLLQPMVIRSVSSEKLAVLLAEEVSEG